MPATGQVNLRGEGKTDQRSPLEECFEAAWGPRQVVVVCEWFGSLRGMGWGLG